VNPLDAARRRWLAQAALITGAGLAPVWAQDNSTKPIKIIVPFPPGGSNDIVGRAVAQQLTARTKRNIIIENRPGAGGVLGAEAVSRAEPDGLTWLLISSTFTMSPAIMKLPFDPVRSFVPIAMLGLGPSVIAVPQSLPFQTIKDLVDYSKKNPGKINFGTAGVASFQHFALELLMQRSGAAFTTVHYKGGSPALVDLAAGHIQVSLGSLIQMQSFLKAGKIKLLAVAGPKRVDLIPQVPTLKESGIDMEAKKNFESKKSKILTAFGVNCIPVGLDNFLSNLSYTLKLLRLFFLRKLAKVNPAIPPPTIIIFLNIFNLFCFY